MLPSLNSFQGSEIFNRKKAEKKSKQRKTTLIELTLNAKLIDIVLALELSLLESSTLNSFWFLLLALIMLLLRGSNIQFETRSVFQILQSYPYGEVKHWPRLFLRYWHSKYLHD